MFEKPHLEKYKGKSTRHNCPHCGERKFSRYINPETNAHYADHVGKCNRASKCGYHYPPRQYYIDNGEAYELKPYKAYKKQEEPEKPEYHIPIEVLKSSLKAYNKNNFASYLNSLFGTQKTERLINSYLLGTSGKWDGANVFWYVNKDLKVRYGGIMLYDPITGKRSKDKFGQIASELFYKLPKPLPEWLVKYQDQDKVTCLFGEHLLKGNTKPIAICESEKTAMIASVYLPQFIWLASGGKSWLSLKKLESLRGLNVTLYPDLGAYSEWKIKADNYGFNTSDVLERLATDEQRKEGLDIADWLIQLNAETATGKASEPEPIPYYKSVIKSKPQPKPTEPPNKYFDTSIPIDKSLRLTADHLQYPKPPPSFLEMVSAKGLLLPAVKPKTDFERMKEKHPNLNELINRMDLVLI